MNWSILSYLYFTVYNFTQAWNIILLALIVLSLTAGIVGFIMYAVGDLEEEKIFPIVKKMPIKTILFITFLTLFIPSKEQMKTIIGAYVLQSVTQIKGADKLPENVVNAMNSFLQDFSKKESK